MALTTTDIEEFLNSEPMKRGCLRCGERHWTSGGAHNFKGMIALGDDGADSIVLSENNLPVVWLVCQNCGHTEFFAAKFLRAWKAHLKRDESVE